MPYNSLQDAWNAGAMPDAPALRTFLHLGDHPGTPINADWANDNGNIICNGPNQPVYTKIFTPIEQCVNGKTVYIQIRVCPLGQPEQVVRNEQAGYATATVIYWLSQAKLPANLQNPVWRDLHSNVEDWRGRWL